MPGLGGSFLLQSVDLATLCIPENLTEEQVMIAKMVEDFVHKQVRPVLQQIDAGQFSETLRLLREAGELGLLAHDVPEAYGGMGLDKVSSALITEKIALAGSFSLSHGAHVGIGTLPIVFFGNEQQKQKYLPSLASGEKLAAYALTEPSSGSDALSAKTTATLSKDRKYYVLNGEKQWITNAGFADLFIVYAKVDGQHFSAFIVERNFLGVSTGAEEKKMGISGSSTCTLHLDEVKVPVDHLLGEVGKGHKIAFNILNMGRLKLASGSVGNAKHAIKLAVSHAQQRKQFGLPLTSFGLIQEKLAEMAVRTYALESVAYRISGLFEQGLAGVKQADGAAVAKQIADLAIECSLAKVLGSETLDFVVDEAVQIHGGYGYMREYEIENMYRASRINRIFEGTSEINRLLIPVTLLRKTQKGELPLTETLFALQQEMLSYVPPSFSADTPALQIVEQRLSQAKKVFYQLAGTIMQQFADQLQQQQEIARDLADIVIEIFALESAYARAAKVAAEAGVDEAALLIDYATAYAEYAISQIEHAAKHALSALPVGDEQRIQLAMLRKFTRREPLNEVALKRSIAGKIVAAGRYVT